ncbi:hypothetical protein [Streptomyces sp. BE133]|uniref:hypothetical protein n=1 Tax=Streptomyces sp. BE133 TaxID=3002523 RepID=UPI003FA6F2EA
MKHLFAALDAPTDHGPHRRDVAAAVLGGRLRGTALDADAAPLMVGHLVSLAVAEPVTEVRETALNPISEAFDRHDLPLDLVEPPAPAMPQMTPQLLTHALCIPGATQDPQARPLIEPLLRHHDPDVREEARRAAAEITAPKPEGRVHKS